MPDCSRHKGLVVVDGLLATVSGAIALALFSDNNDQEAGLVPLAIGAAFGASAWRGNGVVDECNADYEAYAREMGETPPMQDEPERRPSQPGYGSTGYGSTGAPGYGSTGYPPTVGQAPCVGPACSGPVPSRPYVPTGTTTQLDAGGTTPEPATRPPTTTPPTTTPPTTTPPTTTPPTTTPPATRPTSRPTTTTRPPPPPKPAGDEWADFWREVL